MILTKLHLRPIALAKKNISDIAIISKEITVKILGAGNPGSGVIVNKKK